MLTSGYSCQAEADAQTDFEANRWHHRRRPFRLAVAERYRLSPLLYHLRGRK